MDEDEYKAALSELSRLMEADPDPGTPDGDRLLELAVQIERYEGDL